MSDTGGSIKNPENEAESPASMPEASMRQDSPENVKVPETPAGLAGQHGGGKG
jgi:hypothetical protein